MAYVLRVHKEGSFTVEIHLLNPGQTFPFFGGSSRGLTVRKTASMIVRTKHPMVGIRDLETEIHDMSIWQWVSGLVNEHGFTMDCPHDNDQEKAT